MVSSSLSKFEHYSLIKTKSTGALHSFNTIYKIKTKISEGWLSQPTIHKARAKHAQTVMQENARDFPD